LRRAPRGLKGVRHGQQVMGIAAINAAPAEMDSKPGRVGAADQLLEAAEMLTVERFSRAEIHGDAVLHHAIAFQDLVQDLKRTAAFHHEVFRNDFKPVYDRPLLENMVVMRDAQPDPDAVILVSAK